MSHNKIEDPTFDVIMTLGYLICRFVTCINSLSGTICLIIEKLDLLRRCSRDFIGEMYEDCLEKRGKLFITDWTKVKQKLQKMYLP
jgi:hypothetical protein